MTFTLLIAFAYVAVAGLLDVNLVFAAFLAGFAVSRKRLGDALATISGFSFALFIPVYFALVGYSLIFGKAFSIPMLLAFLAGACVLKLLAVALGARLAGFRGLDITNLAVATNARGGPGIVLASVAFEAGIISAAFYTTLVLGRGTHITGCRSMAGVCLAQRLAIAFRRRRFRKRSCRRESAGAVGSVAFYPEAQRGNPVVTKHIRGRENNRA